MQVTLSESGRRRKRTTGGTMLSVVLHTAVLGSVAAGAGHSKTPEPVPVGPDKLIYTHTDAPPKRAERSGQSSANGSYVPPQLPPIDSPIPIDPVDVPLTLDGKTLSVGDGLDFVPARPGGGVTTGTPPRVAGDPYDAGSVETPVHPLAGNPSPRYPSFLAQAGVEGSVVMRYVVDTLGRVEPASIATVRATHAQFERAVRDVLPRLHFAPAEVQGRRVRQLVEQSFGFELKR